MNAAISAKVGDVRGRGGGGSGKRVASRKALGKEMM
jgi:hypothetical protein